MVFHQPRISVKMGKPHTSSFQELRKALAAEHIYQPSLQLPLVQETQTDITCGMRDGSVHVLRCLKVWFDLPSEVLLLATYSMDRFLSKMKALKKHLACISVSALHMAAIALMPAGHTPALSQLATISQCGCTERDLVRMADLMEKKLGPGMPTTPAQYLNIFIKIIERKGVPIPHSNLLMQKMEILACDASCSNFRPCELALVLLCMHCQEPKVTFSKDQVDRVAEMLFNIQRECKIGESSFGCCHEVVLQVFKQYNGHAQIAYRQRLVWRVSQRTMRILRPRAIIVLPTIEENALLNLKNPRKRSQSLSSEGSSEQEREDWLLEEDMSDNWAMLPLYDEDECFN